MSPSVVFHEAAETELNDAAAYYEAENPGLGLAFIDEIEAVLHAIEANPHASPRRSGRVRRRPLVQFPYSVLYSFDGTAIRILAVAHQRRRPYYWRRRK